jgi:Flp pilus assembly protein TadD
VRTGVGGPESLGGGRELPLGIFARAWGRVESRVTSHEVTMNSWVKESVPAELSPAAVVVALERDLLMSSMSRPAGSAAPIAPSAVPEKAGPGARAAAEVVALVRRGHYLAALRCPEARALLLGPRAEADAAPASADASGAAAAADFYASIASNVAAASAAASARGGVEPAAHELLVLAVGVAALNAFHQVNVTGPDLPNAPACPAAPAASKSASADKSASEWNKHALARLAVDGEDLVGKCRLPQYLLLASALLVDRCATRTEALVQAEVTGATLADARAAAARDARRGAGAGAGRVRLWSEPRIDPEPSGSSETETRETLRSEPSVMPPSYAWWCSRAVLAHQRLLSGRSPTLRRRALGAAAASLSSFAPENKPARVFGAAIAVAAKESEDADPTQRLLASMCLLEAALMEHEYGHVDSAHALLERAKGALGVELELVGKMGFRTVHQTDAKAQMVLEASCGGLPLVSKEKRGDDCEPGAASEDEADDEHDAASDGDATKASSAVAPSSAAMARIAVELQGLSTDGSQILTAPRLVRSSAKEDGEKDDVTDENDASSLNSLPAAAQALILASAVTVRKSQADDGTRSWSVAPYHELVSAQRRSRPILRAAAAVLMSRHERERARTRERALLVLEDLVRGLDAPLPSASARARFAHTTWFPPSSKLRKELGDCLIAIGMVGPALELFEEIELWDALVVCLGLLGKKQAAADVVRRRLTEDPTDAKLWCALGDALDDESHYEKALLVSDGRSARACRSLARGAAAREDWPRAARYWSDAMRLNPLFPEGWFSCGYALLKAEREDEALSAFVRCTQADAENGQAWNNVAALNIRRGRFDAAHVALREATKQIRNNWQTWENLAMVSAKVGHFQQSARALVRVMELTDGAQLHMATLSTLVERCLEARRGVATWLGVEDRRDAETARAEARRAAALGNVAEVDDDDDEEEEETWDGVGGEAGGDAGDAAADMLDAFFSDSEDGDADASASAAGTGAGAEDGSPETVDADTVATQVLAREVVRLEASVEDVFRRALGGGSAGARAVTETADVWRLVAEFREARGETLVASEARLKRVRALDGSGWRKDKVAFVDYADASLEMCRGSLRNANRRGGDGDGDAETLSAEEARRGVSQARMHLRGVLKVFEAQEWAEEMPQVLEELEKCAAEVEKAEQEVV